jgi:hypothetical protein
MLCEWSYYFIQGRENFNVYRLEEILSILDRSLNTRKKRHISGGVLLSISLLFGGLAVTIMTVKEENYEETENYDELYIE